MAEPVSGDGGAVKHVEVQYITREMIVRLTRVRTSLLWASIVDGQWERRAARMLVSGFMFLVSCFAVLLFGGW